MIYILEDIFLSRLIVSEIMSRSSNKDKYLINTMNQVKIINLDGQQFSIESGSSASTSSASSQADISEVSKGSDAVANPGVVAAAITTTTDGGGNDKKKHNDDNDDSESCSECNTTDLLASDPLYFILSRMFITPEGKNIASVLEEINTKLDRLLSSRQA